MEEGTQLRDSVPHVGNFDTLLKGFFKRHHTFDGIGSYKARKMKCCLAGVVYVHARGMLGSATIIFLLMDGGRGRLGLRVHARSTALEHCFYSLGTVDYKGVFGGDTSALSIPSGAFDALRGLCTECASAPFTSPASASLRHLDNTLLDHVRGAVEMITAGAAADIRLA